MNAAVMVEQNKIEYREVEEPEVGSGEVLVKPGSLGLCGTDLHFYSGQREVSFPHISGHEASGVISKIGAGVQDFSPGDRVSVDPNIHCGKCEYCRRGKFNMCKEKEVLGVSREGCFAELIRLPSENVWHLPSSVESWKGALIEPLAVALHVVSKADINYGNTVAVIGAGTIGLLIIQLLHQIIGVKVTAFDKIGEKLLIAEELGADTIVNVSSENLSLRKNTFDRVIDAAGAPQTFEDALTVAAPTATVVWMGLPTSTIEIETFSFVYRELTVRASVAYNPHEFEQGISLVKNNLVTFTPLVTDRFKFDEIPEALSTLEKGDSIKCLIRGFD